MIRKLSTLILAFLLCNKIVAQQRIYYDDQNGMANTKVGGMVQDYRGMIWIATWGGLNMYDGYTFHCLKMKPGDKNALTSDRIRSIVLAPNGNFWCSTDHDIYEFDLKTFKYKDIPESQKMLIRNKMTEGHHRLIDRQENVWESEGRGIYRTMRIHHPAWIISGTEGKQARALFLDKWNRIWIATRDDETVRILAIDGRELAAIPLGRKVYCMYQSKNGDMWLGCKPGGLVRIPAVSSKNLSLSKGIEEIAPDSVYDIQEDRKGRLWIAMFGSGVKCCVNPCAEHPVLTKPLTGINEGRQRKVRKILITNHGNILAATSDGLYCATVNEKNIQRTKFTLLSRSGNAPEGLSNSATMDMVQDRKGKIYVATLSSGIDVIDEQELFASLAKGETPKFRHFSDENSSLVTDFCRSISLLNDTTLMVVGMNNVMLFNPIKETTVNYNRLFWNDTCHFAEGRPLVLPNKDIIFGTDEGAYRNRLKSMLSRGYIPPLLPMYISVNGGDPDYARALSDTIRLKPGEKNVTIGYAALDYGQNKFIMYRSRLDNSPWTNNTDSRELTLFDLEPGTYTLQLQSTDRYGRWVDNVCTITIIVEAYWYETWWARTLFCIFAIGLVGGMALMYYYLKEIDRQRRETLDRYMLLLAKKPASGSQTQHESNVKGIAKELMKPHAVDETDSSDDKDNDSADELKVEDRWFLERIRQYIDENLSNSEANIDDMATAAATSRSTLNRRLNSIIGITAAQLLIDARMQRAASLIVDARKHSDNHTTIADIAYKCGYTDPKYFSRCFKAKYGVTPSEYK